MLQMEPRNQQRAEHPDPRGGVSTCLSVGTSQAGRQGTSPKWRWQVMENLNGEELPSLLASPVHAFSSTFAVFAALCNFIFFP